jgi:hypothetical protein
MFLRPTPADEQLIEKCAADHVLEVLKDSPHATQVFRGLMDHRNKAEIMSKYDLTEKQYAAALKRIRVRLPNETNNGKRSW